jgi:hypothetical protein
MCDLSMLINSMNLTMFVISFVLSLSRRNYRFPYIMFVRWEWKGCCLRMKPRFMRGWLCRCRTTSPRGPTADTGHRVGAENGAAITWISALHARIRCSQILTRRLRVLSKFQVKNNDVWRRVVHSYVFYQYIYGWLCIFSAISMCALIETPRHCNIYVCSDRNLRHF